MKIACDRKILAEAAAMALRGVPARTAYPLQAMFHLCADDSGLTVAGSGHDVGVKKRVAAQVKEPGACAVLARAMADLLNALGDGEVTLSTDGDEKTNLTLGASTYHLASLSPEDYQEPGDPPMPVAFTLPASLLREVVRQTAFAAGDDPSRPTMMGIKLMASDETLKLVATDGSRLAMRSAALPEAVATAVDCIAPQKALVDAARILGDGDVEVSVSKSFLRVAQVDVSLTMRLIEGMFPPFERVIPTGGDKTLTLDTQALLTMCRRIAMVAADTHRLTLRTVEGGIALSGESSAVGRGGEFLAAERTGDDVEMAFDVRFLIDFLAAVGSERVTATMTQPLSPGLWRTEDGTDLKYVLMPMHLM